MSIVRNFNLYLNAGNWSAPFINVNQYDQGEQWVFTLYKEDGTKYTPSTGAIVGIKADNRGIINTGTVDADGRVVINETQQMTAAAGIAIFELLIDGDSHGTANFLVNVEQRPGDNADLSDSDLSLIQQAVNSAAVIVDVIGDGDPSEVIGEHVDAWLDNHPEATTTVEDGAITAPKINQSLWDKLLVSESASGNPASFDDGADDVPVSSLKVNLEPIQTGTGDPSPSNVRPIYPANGKNMIPITLANLQTNNTEGTWNGNAYTYRGVTYTVNTNGGGGVISITANGTATYESSLVLVTNINALLTVGETYTMTGCPSGGTSSTYWCAVGTTPSNGRILTDYGSSATTTYTSQYDQTTRNAYVAVARGYTATNVTFMPQIERGSSASAYQPYQGIMVERCGINQWDEQWELGTIDGNGNNYNANDRIRSINYISVPTGDVYVKSPVGLYVWSYDANKTYLGRLPSNGNPTSNGILTIPNTVRYIRFTVMPSYGTTYNNDISINYPNTITDYHAYIGTSYPYTLGQSVYGGTVDLATGVLTVTHGIVTDFSALDSNGTSSTGAYRYKLAVAGAASYTTGEAVCNMLKFKAGFNDDAGEFYNSADNLNIFLADSTVASAITTLTGCQIVYPLATPQTIQLTPTEVKTLLGYNNISSSGTVDVIYHADTKLYVDKMTAVDNNIIAPTEADFVATRNYTVNDLVIVNDTLYKVTSNIASGSAITPNSNVQQTTLSALIKALS